MFLEYSSKPMPNSRALGTSASCDHQFINKRMLALEKKKNQFDERKHDWLVQKFGLRRPERLFSSSHKNPREALLAG